MLKITLIEDDDTDALMIQRAIKKHMPGAECTWANTVEKGERLLREKGVDVILLDLDLPDSTSPAETCTRISNCAAKTPILISSNQDGHDLASGLVSGGARDFINKALIAHKPDYIRTAIEFTLATHQAQGKIIADKEKAERGLKYNEVMLNYFMGGYSAT